MIRLPIPPDRIGTEPGTVSLTDSERHYLLDVLRLKPGATLEVFDGVAHRYAATLGEGGLLSLSGPLAEGAKAPPITLAQGLVKGEKMEFVIQKATELGASAIAPFASERAVVKLEGARAEERVERWRKIAAAAASQSGRSDIPTVAPIVPLQTRVTEALARGERVVLLYEEERELPFSRALGDDASPVTILVGPEGGFSHAEVAQARAAGARIATLGPRILRTETVALAALSVLLHRRGELG